MYYCQDRKHNGAKFIMKTVKNVQFCVCKWPKYNSLLCLYDFIVNENEGEMFANAKTGRLNWQ